MIMNTANPPAPASTPAPPQPPQAAAPPAVPAGSGNAPAPSRASSEATISFGLVAIPVTLYSAIDGKGAAIARKEFTTDGDPVGRMAYNKNTGQPISDRGTIEKRFEVDGEFVPLDDNELSSLTSATQPKVADIVAFIPTPLVAAYMPEGSVFQVGPGRISNGRSKMDNPAANKALTLLLAAMKAEGVAAVIQLATRERARFYVLTSDGTLTQVYYESEVRATRDWTRSPVAPAELSAGQQLVQSMMATRAPAAHSDDLPRVTDYCRQKLTGNAVVPTTAPVTQTVDDLMAGLQASIDQVQEDRDASAA